MYNQETIGKYLQTKWLGRNLLFYDSVGSTNDRVHQLADALDGKAAPHGTVVAADRQTAGKGRRGRAWESPAGANIYFSLLLRPTFAPDKASMLTLLIAYGVKCGIERQLVSDASQCGIKWPNDVVIDGKKVCGILTEMYLEGNSIDHVIVGVGVNVGKQNFAPELVDKATSLESECGQVFDRSRLLADILEVFEEEYESFAAENAIADLKFFKEKYNACLVNRDREVCVLDPKGEYRGIARGINDTGELLVELQDGSLKEVYAGEVSVRGIYGYT